MFERILTQMGDLMTLAIVSLAMGCIKILVSPDQQSWTQRLVTLFISVFVGTLTGAFALQYHVGDYSALMVSSMASLLSRDIVTTILTNRLYLADLIRTALENIVDKVTK